jgi:hypothetical protein
MYGPVYAQWRIFNVPFRRPYECEILRLGDKLKIALFGRSQFGRGYGPVARQTNT